ncbi:Anthocyanidin 5,3-O-glucosyltransferase [Dendrobium catenatum]|uniref:Glycosyltransferase n=1 Tax=Dendrobium catenatum TaxID=906689 RepID=A0A2I0WDY6_9ASPA|nr:Anthocyanidin 5,3-O-glucosyltransferase [Dendrobium catenatum]
MEKEIIIFPLAERGHLDVMVELAKLLHRSGVSVTILIARIISVDNSHIDTYISRVSTAHPYLSFNHLPPVNPPSNSGSATLLDHFHLVLPHLKIYLYTSSARAIILDFFLSAALEVAAEVHLRFYFFFPSSAAILSAVYLQLPALHNQLNAGGTSIQLPRSLCPIPASDMIRITGQTTETDAMIVQYKRLTQSAGIIVNTFKILEPVALEIIAERNRDPSSALAPVYCVGPITAKDCQEIYSSDELQHESLAWLSGRPRNSVVFLSFERRGSALPGEQIREIAVGLERTGHSFLWVVRVSQELEAALPKGFLERTKKRGLVVKSWVPQVAVLEHPAVGGFVTHCGWTSVLESIVAGVPMIAWPQQKEHMVNKNFLVEVAALAVAMRALTDGLVHSDEIAERVRWLMNSEEGEELRERVAAARVGGMVSLRTGGSSFAAIEEVAREVTLLDLN